MPAVSKLMRTKWYPKVHRQTTAWMHRLESAVVNQSTIAPILLYDEGLGTPSDENTNPEHASFAVNAAPNCYVGSKVDSIFAELEFALTKAALTTDSLPAVKVAFMPIFMSFKNDYVAVDELSSLEIQDVLEMTTEATDRQGYPLYNDVKMVEKYANSALLSSIMPGLTGTQVLEAVVFNYENYYDMLSYMTNSEKLKTCQGGLKWITLTANRPIARIKLRIRPKVKALNEYTFMGVLVTVPSVDTEYQLPISADTQVLNHVAVSLKQRWFEWNPDFNFKKV